MEYEKVEHTLPPIYDKNSKILILGSFPSRKSRENLFYYAHPQNQFWNIMEKLFQERITNKLEFLLQHHIALWDVIQSCEIKGSSDSSIQKVEVNDILSIINNSNITTIFTTGKKATTLYQKYIEPITNIKCIYLPSTSPLYSKMKLEEKIKEYSIILTYL